MLGDFIAPRKETRSSAWQGVGNDKKDDSELTGACWGEVGLLKCYMYSSSDSVKWQHSFQVSGVAAGMQQKNEHWEIKYTAVTKTVCWVCVAVRGACYVSVAGESSWPAWTGLQTLLQTLFHCVATTASPPPLSWHWDSENQCAESNTKTGLLSEPFHFV